MVSKLGEPWICLPDARQLYIEQIFYIFQGQPILFVLRDIYGHFYLCSCYELHKNWVMVPIDARKLVRLIQDEISIREVFATGGHPWAISFINGEFQCEKVHLDFIEMFPVAGAILDLPKLRSSEWFQGLKLRMVSRP